MIPNPANDAESLILPALPHTIVKSSTRNTFCHFSMRRGLRVLSVGKILVDLRCRECRRCTRRDKARWDCGHAFRERTRAVSTTDECGIASFALDQRIPFIYLFGVFIQVCHEDHPSICCDCRMHVRCIGPGILDVPVRGYADAEGPRFPRAGESFLTDATFASDQSIGFGSNGKPSSRLPAE